MSRSQPDEQDYLSLFRIYGDDLGSLLWPRQGQRVHDPFACRTCLGAGELTRDFLTRHQDKLIYGSDCSDHEGTGPKCQGSQTILTVRRLAGSKAIERKLLFENAKRVFHL